MVPSEPSALIALCVVWLLCLGMITNILNTVAFLYVLKKLPRSLGNPHRRGRVVFMNCTEVFLNL